jgi:hypothetical protein
MVVEINRRCELVYDLHDISNIIRKYYNSDLADEMDRLIKENEEEMTEIYHNKAELENLEYMIERIRRIVG